MDTQKFVEQCIAKSHKQPTIRIGSSGAPVRLWQTLMQREIGAAIKADGVFGPQTHAATLAFQRKVGLRADGVVGQKTWTAGAVAPCYAAAVMQQKTPRVR